MRRMRDRIEAGKASHSMQMGGRAMPGSTRICWTTSEEDVPGARGTHAGSSTLDQINNSGFQAELRQKRKFCQLLGGDALLEFRSRHLALHLDEAAPGDHTVGRAAPEEQIGN